MSRRREPASWEALTENLSQAAIAIACVCLIAAALALATERLGGRWTWPLACLPLALIAAIFSPLIGVGIGAACFLAVGIGAVWHRERIDMAGEEAQRARERVGVVKGVRTRRSARRWQTERVQGDRLALGQTRHGEVVTVPVGVSQGVRAFIGGAPGSGKTLNLIAHALAYIKQRIAAVTIDPKSDRGCRDALEAAAEAMGVRFIEWSLDGPCSYNPLGRGSPSEVADKALAGELFTEPHYLRQAQRYLGLELQAMQAAGEWPPTLERVVENFDLDRLDALAARCGGQLAERIAAYAQDMPARARSELSGVRDRLAVLAESELGRWLGGGGPQIELRQAIQNGDVVYFGLDCDRFPLASQMLGAAIISDLVTLSAELQGGELRCLVVIDEFAAIAAEVVARLLARSRAAGISVLLATHTFADLSVARPDQSDSLRRQVLSHIDYLIAHRQSEPEAAELLGEMAGTRPTWRTTRHTRSRMGASAPADEGTRRRTREFVRHPDEFKSLGVGEAIVIEPAAKSAAERVKIWLPSDLSNGR